MRPPLPPRLGLLCGPGGEGYIKEACEVCNCEPGTDCILVFLWNLLPPPYLERKLQEGSLLLLGVRQIAGR